MLFFIAAAATMATTPIIFEETAAATTMATTPIIFEEMAATATATTPIILKEMAATATATTPIIAVHQTNIPTPSSREQLFGNSPLTFPLTYTPLAAPPSRQIAAQGMPFTPHLISTMTMTKADRIWIDIADGQFIYIGPLKKLQYTYRCARFWDGEQWVLRSDNNVGKKSCPGGFTMLPTRELVKSIPHLCHTIFPSETNGRVTMETALAMAMEKSETVTTTMGMAMTLMDATTTTTVANNNNGNNCVIFDDCNVINGDDCNYACEEELEMIFEEEEIASVTADATLFAGIEEEEEEEDEGGVATTNTHPQYRPSPPLPTTLASGKQVPTRCFNPFNKSAPSGFWDTTKKELEECAAKLLGHESTQSFLFINYLDIVQDIFIDEELAKGEYVGYVIHSERDVLLCGLSPNAAKQAFMKIASLRKATKVVEDASKMMPLIRERAGLQKGTFKTIDNYTMRFGYSMNQLGPCPTRKKISDNWIKKCYSRGGAAQQAFVKNDLLSGKANIISTRASLRKSMVQSGEQVSEDFVKWQSVLRPRVTSNFQSKDNKFVRCPFTVDNSIRYSSDNSSVELPAWESSL
jgi:hypothetical protein